MDLTQEMIDFSLFSYREPKPLKREDKTMEFSGLMGLTMTDKYRKGDQLLETGAKKYDLGEVGKINMNTHRALTTISANNPDIPGIVVKTAEGEVYFETGKGFKAMERQSGFKEPPEDLKESLKNRKKKITDFLMERLIEKVNKEEVSVSFTFSELAESGFGIELKNMLNLSEKQEECRRERHKFMDKILELTEKRVRNYYQKSQEEKILMVSWEWNYEDKKLTGFFLKGKNPGIR